MERERTRKNQITTNNKYTSILHKPDTDAINNDESSQTVEKDESDENHNAEYIQVIFREDNQNTLVHEVKQNRIIYNTLVEKGIINCN